MSAWYQQESLAVLHQLGTEVRQGLSQAEVSRRLTRYGPNALVERPPKPLWMMVWEQFTAVTVLVLIAAAVISGVLGDYKDMVAILAIVVFNAILGASQEYQAGKAFAALKQLAMPRAHVCREGHWQEVSAHHLVPGDILRLEQGDQVPADARLLESINLQVQESTFTGESLPVEKQTSAISVDALPLADRRNMIYMGTVVTYGRGRAVVTDTGMHTELGKIADTLQAVEVEQTPLQKRLDQLGRRLALAALSLVLVIFGLGWLRGENLHLMFLTAVSLAVAIIPEGLPAVVTIALSLGARHMLQRQALIRKLPAVETLGAVTTICSDKTGTLTENRMTVTMLALAGQRVELKEPIAEITFLLTGERVPLQMDDLNALEPAITLILVGSALCNNTLLSESPPQTAELLGDPTEIALVVAAARFGLQKPWLEQTLPRVAELPFDSDRKRMTTIHTGPYPSQPPWFPLKDAPGQESHYLVFTKGAVSSLLEVCTHVWDKGQVARLDDHWLAHIQSANDQLAATGMRVLGLAYRELERLPQTLQLQTVESQLIFVGLVGMLDPARPEAIAAVQTCKQAGIRPVMITGDHPLMAVHIATEIGITNNQAVLIGPDLDRMSLDALQDQVRSVSVYARVSPEQKLKIVQALQNQGEIVAMTGDGVNDAPALKKADIGVAMGLMGTDVAKEAADMVLLNDNFATIVAAVEEGRVIYDNTRKFIRYSLTGNTSGVVIMLLAPLLLMPLPLLPLQILWINLLADGLLAIALSVEPAEQDTMQRPPHAPRESMFSRGVGRGILSVGTFMGLVFLGAGYYLWRSGWPHWQTMLFSILAFSRISLALAMRSQSELLMHRGLLTNRPMLVSVVLTLLLQLLVIYSPWLQPTFRTQSLTPMELIICLLVSTVGFWAVELEKVLLRKS